MNRIVLWDLDVGDLVMFGFLLLAAVAVIWSLFRAHKANGTSYYNKFNLIDLISTREGRVDRPAFLEMGTWMLLAWGFIVLVSKAQWGLLVGYATMMCGVFVLRAAHAAALRNNAPPGSSTSTSSTSTSTTTTQGEKPQ